MTRLVARLLAVLLPLALLGGCTGMDRATRLAGTAVERHRELYDAERFGILAANTDPEMKETVPDSQFASIARQIYGTLGPTGASQRMGSATTVTVFGGTRVTLLYKTQFQNGAAQEQFVFRLRGGRARLMQWHVQSPLFAEP